MNHSILSLLYGFGGTDPRFRIHRFFSFDNSITAASTQTQAAATQLVADYNIVDTVTVDGDAVRLPPVSERSQITVVNQGSPSNKDLQLFPYYGEDLGQGTDTSITIPPSVSEQFFGTDNTTTWEHIDVQFVSGPLTSTNGALAAWNGTGGNIIQNTLHVVTSTGLGIKTTPNVALEVAEQFSTANAAYPTARLFYRSVGGSQDNIGPRLEFATRSDGILDTIVVATIDGIATDVTDGTEDGAVVFSTMKNAAAATEDGRIDASGMDISVSTDYMIGGVALLSDSSGTTTLSNIDALDATTKATIEAAIVREDTKTTTDATPTTLAVSDALDDDTTHLVKCFVFGRNTSTGASPAYEVSAVFERSSDTLVKEGGGRTEPFGNSTAAVAGSPIMLVANDTSKAAEIQLVGEAGATIKWKVITRVYSQAN